VTSTTQPITSTGDAYTQWAILLGLVALLGVVAVATLWAVAIRRRARRARLRRESSRAPGEPPPDAWAESGRRLDESITHFDDDDDPDTN